MGRQCCRGRRTSTSQSISSHSERICNACVGAIGPPVIRADVNLVGGICANCNLLDGSYFLDFVSSTGTGSAAICLWQFLPGAGQPCGFASMQIRVGDIFGTGVDHGIRVDMTNAVPAFIISYVSVIGSFPIMCDFNNYDVPFFSGVTCATAGATCFLTAFF